jgi:hypothetical protein
MFKLERIFAYSVIVVLAILLLLKSCNSRCPVCPEVVGTKTTVTYSNNKDTFSRNLPKPVREIKPQKPIGMLIHDWKNEPLYVGATDPNEGHNDSVLRNVIQHKFVMSNDSTEIHECDSATLAIMYDYFTYREYDSTQQVPFGTLRLKAAVYENQMVWDSAFLSQNLPTYTTVKTVKEKSRNLLLFGPGFYYQQLPKDTALGVGVEAAFQSKNGPQIQGGVYVGSSGKMYKASVLFPIRTRRK